MSSYKFSAHGAVNGMLPGDVSVELNFGNVNVGIVGLNSTWLQLGSAEYDGRLEISSRQLMALTNEDPDGWCRRHDLNLLVTHQPSSWFSQDSLSEWRSEIAVPGRFDAHLFGHMHTPNAFSLSEGGDRARVNLQSASLFGLETFGSGITRIHGYSAVRANLAEEKKHLTVWPRVSKKQTSGWLRIVPDQSFTLNEDNSFNILIEGSPNRDSVPAVDRVPTAQRGELISLESGSAKLDRIRYRLKTSKAHASVRLAEQDQAIKELSSRRVIWLKSEWGMGSSGFLGAVISKQGRDSQSVFRFSLQSYSTRERFVDEIRNTLGFGFEELCELISRIPNSTLIFDDIPTGGSLNLEFLERDVEDLALVILEYCPSGQLIMRTRKEPREPQFPLLSLRPLDEPDTSAYINQSEDGGISIATPDVVSRIQRHTDGSPDRVDKTLRELKVVSLSEITASNPDVSSGPKGIARAPDALVEAIQNLKSSNNSDLKRSFSLLKTLSAFPNGE